jgi:hypothetical protein
MQIILRYSSVTCGLLLARKLYHDLSPYVAISIQLVVELLVVGMGDFWLF